ncbi:putative uncharacterized protein [Xanthomonas citri pv. punicae str. LMG 859]|nr:putative uncharacterized protein [Xanthomonas citri pv. punicae str. LMG 859]
MRRCAAIRSRPRGIATAISQGVGETSHSIKRTEQCHERVHSTAVEAPQSQGQGEVDAVDRCAKGSRQAAC